MHEYKEQQLRLATLFMDPIQAGVPRGVIGGNQRWFMVASTAEREGVPHQSNFALYLHCLILRRAAETPAAAATDTCCRAVQLEKPVAGRFRNRHQRH